MPTELQAYVLSKLKCSSCSLAKYVLNFSVYKQVLVCNHKVQAFHGLCMTLQVQTTHGLCVAIKCDITNFKILKFMISDHQPHETGLEV